MQIKDCNFYAMFFYALIIMKIKIFYLCNYYYDYWIYEI